MGTRSTSFDLRDDDAYGRWRARKLAHYPKGSAELSVPIASLDAVGSREREAILDRCRQANMAIYSCSDDSEAQPASLRTFAAGFGLRSFDRHLCADDTGITALSVAETGRRRGYIPYSDRRLSWHTDGYYNEEGKRIRAVLLHCVRDAAAGGENALLDHEIAYIHLRDADPQYIAALMHPEAMTIPANREDGREMRPARVGPVFTIDPATGALHMRFSARKRNIVWRDDAKTRAAVAFLNELLAAPEGPVIRCRMAPGQGIISNNVLHNRSAFQDNPMERRLVYRLRFLDRIVATQAQATT